ncbi:oxysterol-binding -related 1 isoform X1, partial [Brachionus plicatilis]
YTWHNLKVNTHNLVLGKLWFEHTGKTEIVNHKLKIKCQLEYKPYSWFVRQMNRCEGYILDSNDNKLVLLYGKWDQCLFCTNNVASPSDFHKRVEKILAMEENNYEQICQDKNYSDVQLLWKVDREDEPNEKYFNFTKFTLKLNEMHAQLKEDVVFAEQGNTISLGPLPSTDSRHRPDMRLYEQGQLDDAGHEKHRLEEKQREKARKMELQEMPVWTPLWFVKGNHQVVHSEQTWLFNNTYWNRDFDRCPDIF